MTSSRPAGPRPGRPGRTNTIALVGMRCSGKTSVGLELARLLERPFLDLDEETARFGRQAGRGAGSPGELLERVGETSFRELEAKALRCVLEPELRVVLATGGGVVERSDNRAWLIRAAWVVWLDVPTDELARRLIADPTFRPPLVGRTADGGPDAAAAELTRLAARRRAWYAEVANHHLECGSREAWEIALEIRGRLESIEAS